MRIGWGASAVLGVALLAAAPARAQELAVRQTGPEGEVTDIEQANEIRVTFSEPMVVLGRIPQPVVAPFFRIDPAVEGTFRWSGTKLLIFTPARRLPYASKYTVTLAAGATSILGHKLASPHTFSFTTPTLRLMEVRWERQDTRVDSPVILALRFNQPVKPLAAARHISVRYAPRKWDAPELPAEALDRLRALDPAAEADFKAKRAAAEAARTATAVVQYVNTDFGRAERYRGDEWAVLRTSEVPPPQSALKVWIAPDARGVQGSETPGKEQEQTVELESALFVDPFRCQKACDPDSWNALRLRRRAKIAALRKAVKVFDVTDPAAEAPLKQSAAPARTEERGEGEEEDFDSSMNVSLEDVGYTLLPARSYLVTVARTLAAEDGQKLGYTWAGRIENWHRSAFSSFGEGHGVWESKGGGPLPFYARNLASVTQWAAPVKTDELMPTIVKLQGGNWPHFALAPPVPGTPRTLTSKPDAMRSYGIDIARLLSPEGTGLVWAALRDGPAIPRAHPAGEREQSKASLVQVTNLGIAVKDSPHNTLVFVTRLDDGRPVEGATVSIRGLDNKVLGSGLTDASGVALLEAKGLRDPENSWQFRFIVTAEKDGDVAYVGSDWREGLEPWEFGLNVDLGEAQPLLRGSVFTDRGVYKLGEEVHVKAVLRRDDVNGVGLIAAGQPAEVALLDSQGQELEKRTVTLNEWGGADWTLTLPADGPLGHYSLQAKVAGVERGVHGSFLVAAYRRPDFRVDVDLAGESSLAGVSLKGVVTGRYLFGAPMAGQAARWTYSRTPLYTAPPAVTERFASERYVFLNEDWSEDQRRSHETLETKEVTLDGQGQVTVDLTTDPRNGEPWNYTLEGEVTDVSRQAIANRATFRVDPAPWYIGLRRIPYFADVKGGLETEVVAVDLAGQATPDVKVTLKLTQIQWHSARRAEGGGFYAWETERREVPAGEWTVTTGAEPVPFKAPVDKGGYFVLEAAAQDADGRSTRTRLGFYALGPGYTAWARYDHNRIDLVPEKKTYRPGDTARIMIKSPWDGATALLTTEREGIRSWRTFALTSTQQTVSVPITAKDIPNLYVSVLLVKGRSGPYTPEDASDPGKPSFRLGYAHLQVENAEKRLRVKVASDREEYRPAQKAHIAVTVTDAAGQPASAEVTLWAVDYGVLSLTNYRPPDLVDNVYLQKALQVMNEDSRQRIISRRAIVPKGGEEGGGGGMDEGPGTPVRKDFRVLAFWVGSVVTDARGMAATDVTLPESLTTYRIMAVASDKASRFGRGEREIRTSKPVLLRSAFPRFMTVGDRATFGGVVNSQLAEKGTAIVTLRSLDPTVLNVEGSAKQTVPVGAKGTAESRFTLVARSVGRARVQMSVRLHGEADAFEDVVPVQIVISPEVVAAYGQSTGEAREIVVTPAGVLPDFGGLHVELSSTALVGLSEGARYLYTYPYGCAEQRSSAALSLVLAADLGDAFKLPGIAPADLKKTATATLAELPEFQCGDGGFTFWKGQCDFESPYLTSYVLHVMGRARKLQYPVDTGAMDRGYAYLEKALGGSVPAATANWAGYTAWQAFTTKVLAEAGRNVDSSITRLHGHADKMPVFALAYLLDAIVASGDKGSARRQDVERRLGNAILPEGGTAHVEELDDPELLWLWSSSVRTTALSLGALTRAGAPMDALAPMTRWLMKVRKDGRWGNTQENATAMEALVDYYRVWEKEVPDFTAVVRLGAEPLATEAFQGRSTDTRSKDVPMPELVKRAPLNEKVELTFARQGTGTLHYAARLTYASAEPVHDAMDMGFGVERTYSPMEGGAAKGSFKAGELVKVTLRLTLPKERRYVAVNDPLPAGFEPVESWFNTTARDLVDRNDQQDASEQDESESSGDESGWLERWLRGGFDHVERHDDRVLLFATRLAEGVHTFTYVARATTAGTFHAGPARAEEMYEPEVFGRTPSTMVEIKP
jgi:alpha-2-macroglobulin